MHRMTLTILLSLSATALQILASSTTAVASTAQWRVNGSALTGSAALSTTNKNVEGWRIVSAGIEITCNNETVNASSPAIIAPNTGSAQSVEFKGCAITNESFCHLGSETIKILPILVESTLDGTLAIKEVIKPKTKTIFTTIAIVGESCALAGTQPASGTSTALAPTGQDGHVLQLFKSTTTHGELKSGANEVTITGSSLVQLASGLPWSFL